MKKGNPSVTCVLFLFLLTFCPFFFSQPQPTGTNGAAVPTSAYTTVYTITSCPAFDSRCQTGRVTTQTFLPAEATGGSSTGGDGDDKDDAAARPAALTLLFVSLGAFAMFFNLL